MFSGFFIERPKFALVIAIVMTLLGLIAIRLLPIAEYPTISPPNIVVSGRYPGASAQELNTRIKRFQQLLSDDRRITAEQVSDQIFRVSLESGI